MPRSLEQRDGLAVRCQRLAEAAGTAERAGQLVEHGLMPVGARIARRFTQAHGRAREPEGAVRLARATRQIRARMEAADPHGKRRVGDLRQRALRPLDVLPRHRHVPVERAGHSDPAVRMGDGLRVVHLPSQLVGALEQPVLPAALAEPVVVRRQVDHHPGDEARVLPVILLEQRAGLVEQPGGGVRLPAGRDGLQQVVHESAGCRRPFFLVQRAVPLLARLVPLALGLEHLARRDDGRGEQCSHDHRPGGGGRAVAPHELPHPVPERSIAGEHGLMPEMPFDVLGELRDRRVAP